MAKLENEIEGRSNIGLRINLRANWNNYSTQGKVQWYSTTRNSKRWDLMVCLGQWFPTGCCRGLVLEFKALGIWYCRPIDLQLTFIYVHIKNILQSHVFKT